MSTAAKGLLFFCSYQSFVEAQYYIASEENDITNLVKQTYHLT